MDQTQRDRIARNVDMNYTLNPVDARALWESYLELEEKLDEQSNRTDQAPENVGGVPGREPGA